MCQFLKELETSCPLHMILYLRHQMEVSIGRVSAEPLMYGNYRQTTTRRVSSREMTVEGLQGYW